MGRLARSGIIFALSFVCGGSCAATFSQTSQQNKLAKKETGSVSGRVTVKGKGRGGIVVAVMGRDFGFQREPLLKAITDVEGNYRISQVPAGNYQITPLAPAFVMPAPNFVTFPGRPLILSDGENVEGLDFTLVPGGVITGKVSQIDGRPVVEERVFIMPLDPSDPGRTASSRGNSFQTDDRGVYRIFGLPAGRYKVYVGQDREGSGGVRLGRPNFERIFYPNATKLDEAKIVEVSEGSELTNIDIAVGPVVTGFAAGGVALDGETNQPVQNIRFGLQGISGGQRGSFVGANSVSNRMGEFRFENLPPGKYSLLVLPQPNSELSGDPVQFEIVDKDVSTIVFRTSRAATLTGSLVLEGSYDKTVQNKLTQLRLYAYVRNDVQGGGFPQFTSINSDGSFRFTGLPSGVVQFQLESQDPSSPSNFLLARVERDGVPVPGGVQIKASTQVSGVKLFVVYGSGSIRGTVKIANGPPPVGTRLIVRLEKPGDHSFSLPSQEVDARGRFAIDGVPAGTYDLWVHSTLPTSRGRSTSQSVSVTDRSVTEVEVNIDLEPLPAPKP